MLISRPQITECKYYNCGRGGGRIGAQLSILYFRHFHTTRADSMALLQVYRLRVELSVWRQMRRINSGL